MVNPCLLCINKPTHKRGNKFGLKTILHLSSQSKSVLRVGVTALLVERTDRVSVRKKSNRQRSEERPNNVQDETCVTGGSGLHHDAAVCCTCAARGRGGLFNSISDDCCATTGRCWRLVHPDWLKQMQGRWTVRAGLRLPVRCQRRLHVRVLGRRHQYHPRRVGAGVVVNMFRGLPRGFRTQILWNHAP